MRLPERMRIATALNSISNLNCSGRRMNMVLFVEDDRSHAELFQVYLHATGWSTVVAHDAQQGLQLARASTPTAILLDILLPRTDGRVLLADIRRTPALAQTPIIAVSAATERSIEQSCLLAGADVFLAKPLSLRQLGRQLVLLTQRAERRSPRPDTSA